MSKSKMEGNGRLVPGGVMPRNYAFFFSVLLSCDYSISKQR